MQWKENVRSWLRRAQKESANRITPERKRKRRDTRDWKLKRSHIFFNLSFVSTEQDSSFHFFSQNKKVPNAGPKRFPTLISSFRLFMTPRLERFQTTLNFLQGSAQTMLAAENWTVKMLSSWCRYCRMASSSSRTSGLMSDQQSGLGWRGWIQR